MQAAGVCKGQLCLPVARFLFRHAHSSKLRTSLLYRTASFSLRFDKLKLQPPHGLLQVFSSMEEDTRQNDAGTKVVKVMFVLQRRCEFGQQFSVTGDDKLFGAWAPEVAVPMQWSEGHIWTVELDLSVGMCMDFKVILMAEQEVIQWQPGPNCKLELSEASSSLVVFVPWSDEEDSFKNDPQVDVVINEFLRTQDGDETASSVGSLPDLVEDMVSETHSSKSVDVTEEQMVEERSANSGMVKVNAKDILYGWQTEGIVTGNQETIDVRTSLNTELKFSKFISPLAIPESWYGEESEQTNEVSSSHDSTESSPVSLEDIAKGETMRSAFKFTSDDKEEENGENLISLNGPDEVISEVMARSVILTTESEPIAKDENDEELRVHDVPVATTYAGTLLSDTKIKDTNEESSEVITETRSETMISTTASNNQDESDKEVLGDNDPSALTAEVPETENPSMATDSLENVETKPLMTAKEKKWDRKGWSKLWGAFVRGSND